MNLDALAEKEELERVEDSSDSVDDIDDTANDLDAIEEVSHNANITQSFDSETVTNEESKNSLSHKFGIRKLSIENDTDWTLDFTPVKRGPIDEMSDGEIIDSNLIPTSCIDIIEDNPVSIVAPVSHHGLDSNTIIPTYEYAFIRSETSNLAATVESSGKSKDIDLVDISVIKSNKKKKKKKKKKSKDINLDFWGFSSPNGDEDEIILPIFHDDKKDSEFVNSKRTNGLESMLEETQRLPQRIVAGIIGNPISNLDYTFFDKIVSFSYPMSHIDWVYILKFLFQDEEINLDEDPILQRVKDNINRPVKETSINVPSVIANISRWNPAAYGLSSFSNASNETSSLSNNLRDSNNNVPKTVNDQSNSLTLLNSIFGIVIRSFRYFLGIAYSGCCRVLNFLLNDFHWRVQFNSIVSAFRDTFGNLRVHEVRDC